MTNMRNWIFWGVGGVSVATNLAALAVNLTLEWHPALAGLNVLVLALTGWWLLRDGSLRRRGPRAR